MNKSWFFIVSLKILLSPNHQFFLKHWLEFNLAGDIANINLLHCYSCYQERQALSLSLSGLLTFFLVCQWQYNIYILKNPAQSKSIFLYIFYALCIEKHSRKGNMVLTTTLFLALWPLFKPVIMQVVWSGNGSYKILLLVRMTVSTSHW